jgi:hypothetical protein
MFPLMNEHTFEINTGNDVTPVWSAVAGGINNVEPANNEELAQDKYLDGGGFGETDVIAAQLTLAFSGHRKYGDAAQDFIFAKSLTLGNSRRTEFRWTQPDGSVFEGNATIANISGPSGDAGAKGEISFEIHFNGLPEYTPATP